MYKKYDLVYSIGHDCACSMYLNKHNLRYVSGPLDWLTNVPPAQRFELLLNNFDGFMNIDDFEFIEKDPNIFNDENCDYYRNKRTGFHFYHDFAAGIPLSETFNDVAEKYRRRITRFYENIKRHERILLVWFSHYHETSNDEWATFAMRFCYHVGKNVNFLIIQHMENQFIPIITKIAPNITRFDMHTIEKDNKGNITTLGNQKLCDGIFAQFALRIPRKYIWRYAYKKFLIHGVCKFIPHHNIRHAWRNKLNNDISQMRIMQSQN